MPRKQKKTKPISAALVRIFGKLTDEENEEAAMNVFKKFCAGDIGAFKEVSDRVEGKVATSVGGSSTLGPIKLKVEWSG